MLMSIVLLILSWSLLKRILNDFDEGPWTFCYSIINGFWLVASFIIVWVESDRVIELSRMKEQIERLAFLLDNSCGDKYTHFSLEDAPNY